MPKSAKIIAALEADLERVQCELDDAEQALTSERQWREDAEARLRPFARKAAAMWFRNADATTGVEVSLCTGTDEECLFTVGELDAARAHFRKYEPIPADREEERNATNDKT